MQEARLRVGGYKRGKLRLLFRKLQDDNRIHYCAIVETNSCFMPQQTRYPNVKS